MTSSNNLRTLHIVVCTTTEEIHSPGLFATFDADVAEAIANEWKDEFNIPENEEADFDGNYGVAIHQVNVKIPDDIEIGT